MTATGTRRSAGVTEPAQPAGPVTLATADRPAAAVEPAGRAPVRIWLLLAGAVAVALFLRLWRISAVGFNSDEAVYAGQAAALAGNPHYVDMFPVFRAHPMLFQSVLSPLFRAGEVDVAGRVVVAVFGAATVVAVYLVGARLYDRRVGVLAALLVAVMPYHAVVTRQVLLDGPMTLFATVTLYCFIRYAEAHRLLWFVASAGALGLTMLVKESSIVLAGGVYAFVALTPSVRRPLRAGLLAMAVLVLVFATHPVSQALAGRTSTGRSYLVWQLMRRPNHSMTFYLETVTLAIGPLVLVAMFAGLWWLRRAGSWRETLLVCWIAAPVAAFQAWPVKGFQYLLPIVAPVAVLAARALLAMRVPDALAGRPGRFTGRFGGRVRAPVVIRAVVVAGVVATLIVATWGAINRRDNATFLAGSGGVPGGRETGRWLAANTPAGSVVLTLGPSMANIVQYYGHRRCYGLSVSPNPLHRNPAYEPLPNPDRSLRHNELQYVVWDRFSAERSPFFSERLLALARRYHGRTVHTEYVRGSGKRGRIPVIVVYEVRP
jgi:hypothetical protein